MTTASNSNRNNIMPCVIAKALIRGHEKKGSTIKNRKRDRLLETIHEIVEEIIEYPYITYLYKVR